ncbi:MAG: response regulator [Chitinophagaceae bacterium]|nr:response regulator [Chitinophagaceae bacterium]HQV62110.1 response regulator [Chitinophagaceae bacterium]HQV86206.1 response regulator [Chitinophagaceae bacterium]HQX72950.1 response regulator [Chitinophagaceae bacterium]HQZ74102.1 response regulator [Chitinophagaceae bacterium]
MNNAAILIIDDEVQIRRLLEITLESNSFNVESAETAKDGLRIAANHPPDLVILDLGLPDEDGHSVLKKLREWYTKPVIILSVQSSEENIVKALDNGANDYLVKPFRTGELLARIRSALRGMVSEENDPVVDAGDLQIDLAARTVKKNNETIKLTATEYKLLSLLAQHEGKVLTHQYLLREVWGPGYISQSQYLRVFIAQLRKKIETDANRPEHIITESGVGYRFIAKE